MGENRQVRFRNGWKGTWQPGGAVMGKIETIHWRDKNDGKLGGGGTSNLIKLLEWSPIAGQNIVFRLLRNNRIQGG